MMRIKSAVYPIMALVAAIALLGTSAVFAQDLTSTSSMPATPDASSLAQMGTSTGPTTPGGTQTNPSNPGSPSTGTGPVPGSRGTPTSGYYTPSGTFVPGAPNTGAGGDAATNIVLLFVSGTIAVGGLIYLTRNRKIV